MIYIEHVGRRTIQIRWRTSRPFLRDVKRELSSIPLFSAQYRTPKNSNVKAACLAVIIADQGVGILVCGGTLDREHTKQVISLALDRGLLNAKQALAGRSELCNSR